MSGYIRPIFLFGQILLYLSSLQYVWEGKKYFAIFFFFASIYVKFACSSRSQMTTLAQCLRRRWLHGDSVSAYRRWLCANMSEKLLTVLNDEKLIGKERKNKVRKMLKNCVFASLFTTPTRCPCSHWLHGQIDYYADTMTSLTLTTWTQCWLHSWLFPGHCDGAVVGYMDTVLT